MAFFGLGRVHDISWENRGGLYDARLELETMGLHLDCAGTNRRTARSTVTPRMRRSR